MAKKSIIPQVGEMLKSLRDTKSLSQASVAKKLEDILYRKFRKRYYIQQSDISRLETEDLAIDLPKLFSYAECFDVNIKKLIAPEFSSLLDKPNDIHWHQFDSDAEAEAKLQELEKSARILISTKFPSSLFCLPKTSQRYRQLNEFSYQETDIYTVEAFLTFLFSPIENFTVKEKINLLKDCIQYFEYNINRRLFFFPASALPKHSQLPSMEILPVQQSLILSAPVSSLDSGDAFIEVRDQQIYNSIASFYTKLPMFKSSMVFLDIAIETLENAQGTVPSTKDMVFFGHEITRARDRNAQTIIKCFTPEIQAMINSKPPVKASVAVA